jgi:hypothetical protein
MRGRESAGGTLTAAKRADEPHARGVKIESYELLTVRPDIRDKDSIATHRIGCSPADRALKQMGRLAPDRNLIAFSNLQLLDAEFTDSQIPDHVGKTPAFAPDVLFKGGIMLSRDRCFDISLTAVYVSDQFWSDANTGLATIPAKIPSYKVFNLGGDFYIRKNLKVIFGVSNLADEKYYSRIFFDGSIELAPRRSGYAGVSVEF